MSQQQRHNRVAIAITLYFGSATASLAWILHRARPARARTWSALVQDAASLWDPVPSEPAVFVYLNFFVSALAMAAVITASLFLGRLSVTESQRLSHRLVKYAVFKMVFVGSVITPDPRDIAVWLAWFAVVGFLRVFLGAAKDRLESLLSSPGAQVGRHARGVCLLLLVMVHNAVWFALVLRVMPGRSVAKVLLCAFDCAVVAIEGLKTLLRYAVHMADRYQCRGDGGGASAAASPAAMTDVDDLTAAAAAAAVEHVGGGVGGGGWDVGCWSGKGNFLYHAELVADVLVHAVTLAHYMHVWVLHGLSFHLIDAVLFLDMRAVLLSLLRRLRSHLSYRAATQRLNTTFRDVHPAALAAAAGAGGGASADCTICMDEIVHVGKQLPCGHVFHLSCLRAWLQQSGSESFTCPNCRTPILVGGPGGAAGGQADDGGGGQRRQEPSWWLVRTLDRLYVRMWVTLEPLLLAMLLSVSLWLDSRAQSRRRHFGRSPPSPLREGFGESPGPSSGAARGGGGGGGGGAFRSRSRFAGDSDLEEDEAAADAANEYDTDDDEEYGGCGPVSDLRGAGDREEKVEDAGEAVGEERDDGRDADSDAEADGAAADARRRRSGGWARHICSALGAGHGCDGGCTATGGRRSAAAAAAAAAATPPQSAQRRQPGPGAGRWGSWAGHSPALEVGGEGLEERLQGGGMAGGRRRGASWRSGWRAEGGGGDVGGAGPSTGPAGATRRGTLRALPPSAEVPSYSGDVLVPQAAAAARHIGRTISASLRSSWAASGPCAGAVAWCGGDDNGEVSSRRRRPRARAARPGGATPSTGGPAGTAARSGGRGDGWLRGATGGSSDRGGGAPSRGGAGARSRLEEWG